MAPPATPPPPCPSCGWPGVACPAPSRLGPPAGSQISPEAVQPYLQPIITALLKFSNSQDPDLTQAASYGLGVCAQYGSAVFRQVWMRPRCPGAVRRAPPKATGFRSSVGTGLPQTPTKCRKVNG